MSATQTKSPTLRLTSLTPAIVVPLGLALSLLAGAEVLQALGWPPTQQQQQPPLAKCPQGAPPQWRPHLDAASKAHLAPGVALGQLTQLSLTPIQLTGGWGEPINLPPGAPGSSVASWTQHANQLGHHLQSVNNAGVAIEATFLLGPVLKKTSAQLANLAINQTLKLNYKLSASLSTTNFLMNLIKLNSAPSNLTTSLHAAADRQLAVQPFAARKRHTPQLPTVRQQQVACSLELSELEINRRASSLFKLQEHYVLFLDQQAPASARYGASQVAGRQLTSSWWSPYPFASHEPLNGQTRRSLRKILCKNCAQVPQVELVNATFVSVASTAQQPQLKTPFAAGQRPHKIRLDCRVTSFPAPWIQWFKNGKQLHNSNTNNNLINNNNNNKYSRKNPKFLVRTNKVKRQSKVWLSSLSIELRAGKNETGVYECRAMNVAAREPAVGTYTLIELADHYELIPVQPAGAPQPSAEPARQPPPQQPKELAPAAKGDASRAQSAAGQPDVAQVSGATSRPVSEAAAPTEPPPRAAAANEAKSTPSSASNSISSGINSGNSIGGPQVDASQCPGMKDEFCLNKGTCRVIAHIQEYLCKCADGYHGRRCEYKSLGHQQAPY